MPYDRAAEFEETTGAALLQFYDLRVPPSEINLPIEVEDCEALEELLSERAGRRVKIAVPQRGDKRRKGSRALPCRLWLVAVWPGCSSWPSFRCRRGSSRTRRRDR